MTKIRHDEYHLQTQVCDYLRLQYPKVLFFSDTIASVKLTMGQAIRNKKIQKEGFKMPDLMILHPNKHGFHGLCIELKIESPYKQNGELYSDKHLQGQAETIKQLCELGYVAAFAWTFDMAKKNIDDYMKDI